MVELPVRRLVLLFPQYRIAGIVLKYWIAVKGMGGVPRGYATCARQTIVGMDLLHRRAQAGAVNYVVERHELIVTVLEWIVKFVKINTPSARFFVKCAC